MLYADNEASQGAGIIYTGNGVYTKDNKNTDNNANYNANIKDSENIKDNDYPDNRNGQDIRDNNYTDSIRNNKNMEDNDYIHKKQYRKKKEGEALRACRLPEKEGNRSAECVFKAHKGVKEGL